VDWLDAIQYSRDEPSIHVTILTGKGKYYCIGQELRKPPDGIELRRQIEMTTLLVEELIRFPKLLIAAVNGKYILFLILLFLFLFL